MTGRNPDILSTDVGLDTTLAPTVGGAAMASHPPIVRHAPARPRPGRPDRRHRGDRRPVRSAPHRLCRPHRLRARRGLRGGRDPHPGPAVVRQHPQRELGDRTADHAVPRGGSGADPSGRSAAPTTMWSSSADPAAPARSPSSPPCSDWRPARPSTGHDRWCSWGRTSITPTSCSGGNRRRMWSRFRPTRTAAST